MKFNPEISLGAIIEILAFAFTLIGVIHKFSVIEAKLNIMYTWWETNVLRHHSTTITKEFFGDKD